MTVIVSLYCDPLLLVTALLAIAPLSVTRAQGAPATPDGLRSVVEAFPEGLTEQQLDAVLAVTDDAEVRAALRERLLAEMAAERAPRAACVAEHRRSPLAVGRPWHGAARRREDEFAAAASPWP